MSGELLSLFRLFAPEPGEKHERAAHAAHGHAAKPKPRISPGTPAEPDIKPDIDSGGRSRLRQAEKLAQFWLACSSQSNLILVAMGYLSFGQK
jgi:hypothetical protein